MSRPHTSSEPRLAAADVASAVNERELLRLLGLPRGRELEGELRERADEARAWYARSGGPFVATRRIAVAGLEASRVRLADGTELRSGRLASGLSASRGHAVVGVAVSAGREVHAEIARRWAEDRPDEAWFLDRFATAVAEALLRQACGMECRAASAEAETLLPPLSPGCSDFELGDQHRLMALLGGTPVGERVALGPIELLDTGALDPVHSLLAAAGVTREPQAAATPEALCRACDLDPCGFRRVPAARLEAATEGVA